MPLCFVIEIYYSYKSIYTNTQNNKRKIRTKRCITYNKVSSLFPLGKDSETRIALKTDTHTHTTQIYLLTSTSNVLEFEEDSEETNRQRR